LSSSVPIFAVIALLPSLLFLVWFLRFAGRAPEPAGRVLAACLGGALAFGAAVAMLDLAEPALSMLPPRLRFFLGAAAVEETLKLVAILLAAGLPSRWGRMSSGLVFSTAVALGFAAAENIGYTQQFGLQTGLLRALSAVPGHALHTALIGAQLGRAHSESGRSALRSVGLGLVLAVAAHGLYNSLLGESALLRTAVVPLLLAEAALVLALVQRAREEDLSEVVGMLAGVPSLERAPAPALRQLATRALKRRVGAGKRLLKEGDPSNELYLVLAGALEVQRRGDHGPDAVAQIGVGEFFGEMGLLLGRSRSASVVAVQDALVLELSGRGVHEAIAMVEGLAASLRGLASGRGVRDGSLPSVAAIEERAVADEELAAAALDAGSLAARLRTVPLLSGLRTGALRLLAHGAEIESYRDGAVLLRTGSPGGGLCLLLDGTAEVTQDGTVLATLASGASFGEISVLTGFAATATVRATSPVRLAHVRGSQLRDAVAVVPQIGLELLADVGWRLEQQTRVPIPSRPTLPRHMVGLARRAIASLGFGRAVTRNPHARALVRAFPQLLEMPASAADTLADLGAPASPGGEGIVLTSDPSRSPSLSWFLPAPVIPDALARSPHLLHLLARHVRSSSVLEPK